MAANNQQISDVINAVYSRTKAGQLSWGRSAERGKFQCRVGDYVIQLASSISGLSANNISPDYIQITVSKIDGQIVEVAGGINAMMSGNTSLSSQDKQKLRELYLSLSTSNQDLDALLKLLK